MKRLVIILAFFISKISTGQSLTDLNMKAFNLFIDNKYDSALFIYKQLILSDQRVNNSYYYSQVGACYDNLSNLKLAKESYLDGLKDTFDLFRPVGQRACCHGLADVYMKENNFNDALKYLRLAEQKFPHHKICNAGEFERKIWLRYKFAKCFDGINQIDSAISYLTPYMFAKPENLSWDSSTYLGIINYYYSLLLKNYSVVELKSQMDCALQNTFYKTEADLVLNTKFPNHHYFNVLCYLNFLDNRVTLRNGGYEAEGWGGEPVLEFSKESLLKYFMETPGYNMIAK